MLDVLKFVFSGFWVFIGSAILLNIVVSAFSSIFIVLVRIVFKK